jgi:hypothetical protein
LAALRPDAIEALGETTFAFESGSLGGDLTIEQATGYGDEREGCVGCDLGVSRKSGRCGRSILAL